MIVEVQDIAVLTRFLDGGHYGECGSCKHKVRFPTQLSRCPSCCAPFSAFSECSLEAYKESRKDDYTKETR